MTFLSPILVSVFRKTRHAFLLVGALCACLGWTSCQKIAPPPSATALSQSQDAKILHYLDSLNIENSRIFRAGTETYPPYVVMDTAKPGARSLLKGMTVMARYSGRIMDSTDVFEENYSKPEPFRFDLGTGDVIKGWDEGLLLFHIGESGRLFIPSALAYGTTGSTNIPSNAILIYHIRIENAQ